MKCPKCHEIEDKVIDSRLVKDGEVIRRRRVCQSCGFRFTTYEEVIRSGLRVLKRSGITEEFKPVKILQGIQKSCEKRPVGQDQINQAVDAIVKELEEEYEKEVPSMEIGKKIMRHLEHLDEVAFVRFASVYRRYRDVNQFLSEVESLIGRE